MKEKWVEILGIQKTFPSSPDELSVLLRRRGFVLVAILVIVMLLSMLVVSLLFRFKAEDTAASASLATEQAWAVAMSGIHEAVRVATASMTGKSEWRHNPAAFRNRLVFEDGGDRWYFTVWSPATPDELVTVVHGLTDEASRLNIHTSTAEQLAKIPGMNLRLSQTLRDFLDSDDIAMSEGVEQEYYGSLPNPYQIRNGPLRTLGELRLVRGFSIGLIQGEDWNLNGRLDPNEDDADERVPIDNKDGKLELGLRQYLTVHSYDPNENRMGLRRVNINRSNETLPAMDLPEAVTNYIYALRSSGMKVRHPADLLEATARVKASNGVEHEIASGVGKSEIGTLLDNLGTTSESRVFGLVNINTASAAVLSAVPGIDEALAESIVSTRRAVDVDRRHTIAWLYQEGLVDAVRFKEIAPYLTARSFQFRFLVVGFGLPLGRFRVLEVGIDLKRGGDPITFIRDITKFGVPFPLLEESSSDPSGSFQGASIHLRFDAIPERYNKGDSRG